MFIGYVLEDGDEYLSRGFSIKKIIRHTENLLRKILRKDFSKTLAQKVKETKTKAFPKSYEKSYEKVTNIHQIFYLTFN
jgi:hypothetical protein